MHFHAFYLWGLPKCNQCVCRAMSNPNFPLAFAQSVAAQPTKARFDFRFPPLVSAAYWEFIVIVHRRCMNLTRCTSNFLHYYWNFRLLSSKMREPGVVYCIPWLNHLISSPTSAFCTLFLGQIIYIYPLYCSREPLRRSRYSPKFWSCCRTGRWGSGGMRATSPCLTRTIRCASRGSSSQSARWPKPCLQSIR